MYKKGLDYFIIQIGVHKFVRCGITFESYEAQFALLKRYLIDDIIGKNKIFVELSWRLYSKNKI